jgi:hypothetical protein
MPSRQIPGPKGGTLRPNQPGERRGGRQAGTPNKATRALRELILLAAESVGRPKIVRNRRGDIIRLEETGKDGALGYLRYLALHEPRTFGGLLGRVLPLQVAARLDGGVDVNQRLTLEEAREELRRRGLPEHIFGVDRPQLEHPEATPG